VAAAGVPGHRVATVARYGEIVAEKWPFRAGNRA